MFGVSSFKPVFRRLFTKPLIRLTPHVSRHIAELIKLGGVLSVVETRGYAKVLMGPRF